MGSHRSAWQERRSRSIRAARVEAWVVFLLDDHPSYRLFLDTIRENIASAEEERALTLVDRYCRDTRRAPSVLASWADVTGRKDPDHLDLLRLVIMVRMARAWDISKAHGSTNCTQWGAAAQRIAQREGAVLEAILPAARSSHAIEEPLAETLINSIRGLKTGPLRNRDLHVLGEVFRRFSISPTLTAGIRTEGSESAALRSPLRCNPYLQRPSGVTGALPRYGQIRPWLAHALLELMRSGGASAARTIANQLGVSHCSLYRNPTFQEARSLFATTRW